MLCRLHRDRIAAAIAHTLLKIAHQVAHIRSIYANLQVRDRSSAVRRARELRLLAAAGRTR